MSQLAPRNEKREAMEHMQSHKPHKEKKERAKKATKSNEPQAMSHAGLNPKQKQILQKIMEPNLNPAQLMLCAKERRRFLCVYRWSKSESAEQCRKQEKSLVTHTASRFIEETKTVGEANLRRDWMAGWKRLWQFFQLPQPRLLQLLLSRCRVNLGEGRFLP